MKETEKLERKEHAKGKPGIMEQARAYTDLIQETLKTDYLLEMKARLEQAGFTCGKLLEPPAAPTITVETNAPESVRMALHNESLRQMERKMQEDKSIPGSWKIVIIHTIRGSLKSEHEIERQTVLDKTAGLI